MIISKKFGHLDPRREAKWFDWEDGVKLLIAPANNNAYGKYMVENMSQEAMATLTTGLLAADGADNEADAKEKAEKAVTEKLTQSDGGLKAMFASLAALRAACAHTILLGWEGLQDEDEAGNVFDVTYTPDQALEYLNGYGAMFTFVQDKANELASARNAVQVDTKKK